MRLCWHKWVKQHETVKLQVLASTVAGWASIIAVISGFVALTTYSAHDKPMWFG